MNNVPVGTCVKFNSDDTHLFLDVYHTLKMMGVAPKELGHFHGTLIVEKGEDNKAIFRFNDSDFTIDALTYYKFIGYYGEAK